MTEVEQLLRGVLAPAVLAGLVLAAGWRPWRATESGGPAPRPDGRAIGGLALGAATLLGYLLLVGPPPLPSAERSVPAAERVVWIAAGVGLLGLAERPLGRGALLVRLGALALALTWVLDAFGHGVATLTWCVALGLAFAGGELLQRAANERPCRALSLALMVAGGAAAVAIALPISAKVGQLLGALTAGTGALWVLSLWRGRTSPAGPALSAWVVLYTALLLCARPYGLGALDTTLLAAAPVMPALVGLPPALRRRPGWQLGLAQVLAAALPAGVALARAWIAFDPDPYAY